VQEMTPWMLGCDHLAQLLRGPGGGWMRGGVYVEDAPGTDRCLLIGRAITSSGWVRR
jgi:hypothetical protein